MQPSLFTRATPSFDPSFPRLVRRTLVHGAWVDHAPAWLDGHEALYDQLAREVAWRSGSREMYGRTVEVPRLLARLPQDGAPPPVVDALREALSRRYRPLPSVSAAWYRDGRDSVAWHGDRMGTLKGDTIVAIVSLGEPRRLLLRPRGGGASLAFALGCGDLLVMGGSCQATWEHCVPKSASASGPRISLMFRERVPDPIPDAP